MITLRTDSRYLFKVFLAIGSSVLLAACQSPTSAPPATEIAQANPTEVAAAVMTQVAEENARVATGVAETLTAQPTVTATFTPVPTNTSTPTETPRPTETPLPTATATNTAKPAPTRLPVTDTPTARPAPVSVYGGTGGPEGYTTAITCSRPAGNCEPVMPPGDISFRLTLGSEASTPWTLFVKYGLSVEKDGVNVSNMFMFVDAGWLPPDVTVEFGASRNFAEPGRYVIRSSGCLINSDTQVECAWTTMAGTTVTFVIQP